jgi:hypothetical protein
MEAVYLTILIMTFVALGAGSVYVLYRLFAGSR